MSVNKLRSLLLVPLLTLASIALGAWELVPQSPGTNNTWSEVNCEAGAGWRPCVKPAKTCRFDSENVVYELVKSSGQGQPGRCFTLPGTSYVWDGVCYSNASNKLPDPLPGFERGEFVRRWGFTTGRGEKGITDLYEICLNK